MAIPNPHQQFLNKVREKTDRDSRLLGIAIAGSIASGSADLESDIDLQIVVKDEFYEQVLAARPEFVEQFGTVVSAFTGEHVGEPRLTIALFEESLLHVDFKFVSLESFAHHRVENPVVLWETGSVLSGLVAENPRDYPEVNLQWIEDRFWVWVHYIASKIKRGETIEALDSFSWMRQMALAPLVRFILGQKNRRSRFLERDAPEFAQKMLATHPAGTSRLAQKQALEAVVTLYRELRLMCPSPVDPKREAEHLVREYLNGI